MTIGQRVVRRVERMRLAVPMALLMAGAAAFLTAVVPAAILERGVAAARIDPLTAVALPFDSRARGVLMLLVAALSGGAVWMLFDRMERPARPKPVDADPDIDLFAPEPPARTAETEAPVRRPLFAASDLGAPMDDVDGGETPFGRPPLFRDEAAPEIPDSDGDTGEDELLLETPCEPDASVDSSIAGMMARLERGLERRGGAAAMPPGNPDALRRALTELQSLTRKT